MSAEAAQPMELAQLSPERRRRSEATKRLRLRVLFFGTAAAAIGAFPIGVAGAWLACEAWDAVQAARAAGGAWDLEQVLAEQPGLGAAAAFFAVLGLVSGAAGAAAVVATVGRERRPPARVLAMMGLPLVVFSTAGLGLSVLQLGLPAALLPSAVGIGLAGWLFGPVLTVWATALLSIAQNHHREQAVALEGELPRDAAEFFEAVGDELEAAGMEFVEDQVYLNAPGRYRRLWIGVDGTVFASALHRPITGQTLQAVSAYSLLEDGVFVESTNAAVALPIPEEMRTSVAVDSELGAAEVLGRQLEMLRDGMDRGARPVRLTPADDAALQEYGLAWFGRQMLRSRKGRATAEMLWLADPYWAEEVTPPAGGEGRSVESDESELVAV